MVTSSLPCAPCRPTTRSHRPPRHDQMPRDTVLAPCGPARTTPPRRRSRGALPIAWRARMDAPVAVLADACRQRGQRQGTSVTVAGSPALPGASPSRSRGRRTPTQGAFPVIHSVWQAPQPYPTRPEDDPTRPKLQHRGGYGNPYVKRSRLRRRSTNQPNGCRMERSQFPRTYGAPPSSMAIHFNHAEVCHLRFVTARNERNVTLRLLRL